VSQESVRSFVATENGLWQLDQRGKEFRRVAAKNLPASVNYLSASSAGLLLAIAGDALWSGDGEGEWKRLAVPPNVDGVLWVKENSLAGNRLLLGTRRGVFAAGPEGDWRMLSNGLPAIGSVTPAFSGAICVIAMSNGGLYESSDGLNTWRRVDTDDDRGRASAVFPAGREEFLIVSEQEGVLLVAGGEGYDH